MRTGPGNVTIGGVNGWDVAGAAPDGADAAGGSALRGLDRDVSHEFREDLPREVDEEHEDDRP